MHNHYQVHVLENQFSDALTLCLNSAPPPLTKINPTCVLKKILSKGINCKNMPARMYTEIIIKVSFFPHLHGFDV